MVVIRRLGDSIVTFAVPFARMGVIPFGGRSTAIRMASNKIVLFASHPICSETRKALNDLGETVSHIIALDVEHHISLSDYIKEYPTAKVVGPKGLVSKRSDVTFSIVQPDQPLDTELSSEFQTFEIAGHPNQDFLWYHEPTKTIVEADVLFNCPSKDQSTGSRFELSFLGNRFHWNSAWHRTMMGLFAKMKPEEFKRAIQDITALPFERIIPCHGDILEGAQAKEAWNTAFASYI